MMKISSVIPKEHGAWGILFIPFFISSGIAACFDFKMLMLFFGILFLYITRKPVEELFKTSWSGKDKMPDRGDYLFFLAIFAFTGVLFISPLIFKYKLTGLILFGFIFATFLAINLALIKKRKERTVQGELVGIAGLCLTAPAAYYTATGKISEVSFLLWGINFFYFARVVFYVKLRISLVAKRVLLQGWRERIMYSRNYICLHIVLLAIIYILLLMLQKQLVIISYIPITIQAFIGISRMSMILNVRRLGYIEVLHSVLFGFLVVPFFSL